MARRGPKPPTEGESPTVVADLGECPHDLSDDAKECFHRLKSILEEEEMASRTDANTFLQYCCLWGIWRRMDRACMDAPFLVDGDKGKKRNPIFDMHGAASARLLQLAKEMVLTPNARSRLKVVAKEPLSDDLEEYAIDE